MNDRLLRDNVVYLAGLVRNALRLHNDPESVQTEQRSIMPPRMYLREMKTIKVHLPRRFGHSTAALSLYEEFKPKSILFYPTHDSRQYHTRYEPWTHLKNDRTIQRMPQSSWEMINFNIGELFGMPYNQYELVIFDGATRMPVHELDAVIEMMDPYVKLFVLLQ